VLIALDRWADLEKLATGLAAEEDAAARAAGKQFLVVALLNRGELGKAEPILDEMLAAREAYPQHQGWAVQGKLAILAGRGEFERGEALVRDYLARPSPETPGNANEPNARRRLAFLAPFLGKPAPAVHVDTWVGADAALGGDPLAKWRGKVVLLDFWQPWCEPCRKAMPALVALQRAHPEELRVVGLCRVEDYGYDVSEKRAVRPIAAADYPAHVADFHEDMELVYPLGIEDAGANSRTYARLGIPTLVLIDRAGIVRYMSVGAGEPGTLEVAVEGVLKGPPRGGDEPAAEGEAGRR
jgi:thiol-disulfide isomerase/thioredoxin